LFRKQQAVPTLVHKPINVYYSGGNHGCVNVRQAISKEVQADPQSLGAKQRLELGQRFARLFPKDRFDLPRGPPRQVGRSSTCSTCSRSITCSTWSVLYFPFLSFVFVFFFRHVVFCFFFFIVGATLHPHYPPPFRHLSLLP
jgi:hypothetical protein